MIAAQQFAQDFHPVLVPPSIVELEEAILGSILFDPDVLESEAVRTLPVAAFSLRNHRLIFAEINKTYEAGLKPDMLTIQSRLAQSGLLTEIGGKHKLAQLFDRQAVHSEMAVQHAKILNEQHQRRHLAESLERVARRSQELDPDAALALAREELERLGQLNNGNPTPETLPDLRDRISKILHEAESTSALKAELLNLAQRSGYQLRDIEGIAAALELEADRETDAAISEAALPELMGAHKQQINPRDYLWGDGGRLADAMTRTAAAMPASVSPIFSTFMAVSGSRVGTSSRIVVKASAKYTQLCIFWVAIVARSGGLKTPVQKVAIDPLVALEIDAKKDYERALEQYNEDRENWQEGDPIPVKPTRKRYLTKDSTLESLERIHNVNPRGLLAYRDELIGEFKAQNMYRGGKGADQEALLDQFNGSPLIVDRKEREITLDRSAISRTGSIQWEVLQDFAGDHDDINGSMARWLFCATESPPRYFRWDESPDTGISETLKDLYKNLELLPEKDYFLSAQSGKMFEKWQNQLVDAELQETHSGMRAVYPKIEAYTVRIALWLHLVNSALAGDLEPSQVVNAFVMKKAIELAKFFLGQAQLVYAVNSTQSGITGKLLKLFQFIQNKVAGVLVRDIKRNLRIFRSEKTAEIKQDCLSLVNQGYLRQDGDRFFAIEQNVATVASDVATVSTAETVENTTFQENVATVDNVDTSEIYDFSPEASPPAPEEVVTSVDTVNMATPEAESLEDPWFESVDTTGDTGGDINNSGDTAPEMVTPDVLTPDVPSGVGFAEALVTDTAPSDPAAPAPRMPEPHELAARLFARGTWKKVLEELDAIASAAGKSRSAIFNRLKKCISGELRNHLLQLLAEEMRWCRHRSELWDWLGGCARKLLAEATELAQAT